MNNAASAGAFSSFPEPRGGLLVQGTYVESVAGHSGFTHESDHPPLLRLKSCLVQKGKMDGEVHALPTLAHQAASERAGTRGLVASWE